MLVGYAFDWYADKSAFHEQKSGLVTAVPCLTGEFCASTRTRDNLQKAA